MNAAKLFGTRHYRVFDAVDNWRLVKQEAFCLLKKRPITELRLLQY